jgi:hypothetical protein
MCLRQISYLLSLHPLTKIRELAEHLPLRPDKETIKKWGESESQIHLEHGESHG